MPTHESKYNRLDAVRTDMGDVGRIVGVLFELPTGQAAYSVEFRPGLRAWYAEDRLSPATEEDLIPRWRISQGAKP